MNKDEMSVVKKALLKIQTLEGELKKQKDPIAIIGIGCRYPGGSNDPESFWKLLSEGRSGVVEIPKSRWDNDLYYDPTPNTPGKIITKYSSFLNVPIDTFDAEFFNISPREAEYMDPQQRLLLEVIWETIENAGIPPTSLAGTQTGVFIGICSTDYHDLILETNNKESFNPYFATGYTHSAAVGRISYIMDFKGPCLAIDTACSSSLVAIDQACQSLHLGKSDLAIAGGINLMLSPDLTIYFSQLGTLTPDGKNKTFDEKASGYVRGEGCGIILLKRLSDAIRDHDRILAVIRGSTVNEDGASGGLTIPSGPAQENAIKDALSQGKLKGEDVDYIETHGAATPLGDPIEIGALGATYGKRSHPLLIGAVKTNIGHTEGAAGVAGLLKIVLSFIHEAIPPILNFEKLNPHIQRTFPFEIVTNLTPWKKSDRIRRAGTSSFSFSGINSHVILEEPPTIPSIEHKERSIHLLTLSAKTEKALEELINTYKKYLASTKDKIEDIVYTANVGRSHFEFRAAVLGKNLEELKSNLEKGNFQKGKISHSFQEKIGENPDWEKLAKKYVEGASLDWKSYETRTPIHLPTYPFQRERFWCDTTSQKGEVPRHEYNFEGFSLPEQLGSWIIFGEAPELIKILPEAKSINPQEVENFVDLLLLEQMQAETITAVLYFFKGSELQDIGNSIKVIQAMNAVKDTLTAPLVFITQGERIFKNIADVKQIELFDNPNPELIIKAVLASDTGSLVEIRQNKCFITGHPKITVEKIDLNSPEKVKEFVEHTIRSILGLSASHPLDMKKGFFDMGFDSLMAVELKSRLQAGVGSSVAIPPTVAFDHSNGEKLITFLTNSDIKQVTEKTALDEMKQKKEAEIEKMSEEELMKKLFDVGGDHG